MKKKTPKQTCRECGTRWAQGRLRLCATCRRILHEQTVAQERIAHQLAERRRLDALRTWPAESHMQARTIRGVGGQEFDVVWDGT